MTLGAPYVLVQYVPVQELDRTDGLVLIRVGDAAVDQVEEVGFEFIAGEGLRGPSKVVEEASQVPQVCLVRPGTVAPQR